MGHPEPGFYTLGVKSYGRAPTFLMATGFEQARSVVAAMAGDLAAADRVELELPETGVCGLGVAAADDGGAACCGSGAVAASEAQSPAATPRPASGCATPSCGVPPAAARELEAPVPARCCG